LQPPADEASNVKKEIVRVQRAIGRVEKEIKITVSTLDESLKDGDQESVRYCRKKEEQLRKKEEQLRDELRLLMEKELMLRPSKFGMRQDEVSVPEKQSCMGHV
jgi:hypothetical protein